MIEKQSDLKECLVDLINKGKGLFLKQDIIKIILTFLFQGYISKSLIEYIENNHLEEDYSTADDIKAESLKEICITEKGYYIKPSQLFKNIVPVHKDKELLYILMETLNDITDTIDKDLYKDIKYLFIEIVFNYNRNKSLYESNIDYICRVICTINSFNLATTGDLSYFSAFDIMLEFYNSTGGTKTEINITTNEVSELISKIVISNKKDVNNVYDPCIGSGNMALKLFNKIIDVKEGIYGEEINENIYNLSLMNLIIHNIEFKKIKLYLGDTTKNPIFLNKKKFDIIISNPPYALDLIDLEKTNINNHQFLKENYNISKCTIFCIFMLHIIDCLAEDGIAAVICYPGFLQREGSEKKVRKYLIDSNLIEAIIELPNNTLSGTFLSPCLIILKKNKKDKNVLFINAINERSEKNIRKKLLVKNIDNIVKAYKLKSYVKVNNTICNIVNAKEIQENDYNLGLEIYYKELDGDKKIENYDIRSKINSIILEQDKIKKELNEYLEKINYDKNNELKEHITIDSIFEIKNGKKINEENIKDNGKYEYITSNGLIKHTNKNNAIKGSIIIKIFGNNIGEIRYLDNDMWIDDFYCILILKNNMYDAKYIYYYLKNNYTKILNIKSSIGFNRISMALLKKITLDLPALNNQKSIREIMDIIYNYDNQIINLLKEELDIRYKEEEYYLKKLLEQGGK